MCHCLNTSKVCFAAGGGGGRQPSRWRCQPITFPKKTVRKWKKVDPERALPCQTLAPHLGTSGSAIGLEPIPCQGYVYNWISYCPAIIVVVSFVTISSSPNQCEWTSYLRNDRLYQRASFLIPQSHLAVCYAKKPLAPISSLGMKWGFGLNKVGNSCCVWN